MTKKKAKSRKTRSRQPSVSAKAVWKGSIDFGLVNIPVTLHAAEASRTLDFDMLDKRNFARVRYRRVNEKTGGEVPWNDIVKGYQYEKGKYVALTDKDFQAANVEATQTIAITEFVNAADISPIYFDKPYYVEPGKNGRRAYALLRDTMKRTGKVGIANVVIRTRQHLAVLHVQGPLLVLNLLRFAHELRDPASLNIPPVDTKKSSPSRAELKMAERLVETMKGTWKPERYRDEYRDDLLRLIAKKVKLGRSKSVPTEKMAPRAKTTGRVIDIMHLLRRSVEKQRGADETPRRRKTG